ncbi:hypothetical protein DMB66_07995 [Actinoplanes sp. ATCC 53533]|uniref:permease-like cell division protein FtsX n=1 Tax=Actinoplanes sp. ATCC 53533 TaxID=1288362 RepID=UPI000F7A7C6D|nr:permease-like cell division protein FtsX [Actinoplanes sp. ATCC 53533]RSM70883.1 hypothetical protein DMB66_07995 [Actinoplanes sp. ATCC 53533]
MPHNLHDLFERALDDEPVPPPGDPVRQAMAHGQRIRRRRGLLAGASAAAVVVTAAVALNVVLAPAEPPPVSIAAAMMAPADPACAWPVQDDATDVSIFLNDHITLPQTTELRDALWTDPAVRVVRFESRAQAYQRFKALWADSPDFVAAVSVDSLPESFRLELAEPSGYRQFAARFEDRAGVAQVIGRACRGTHK